MDRVVPASARALKKRSISPSRAAVHFLPICTPLSASCTWNMVLDPVVRILPARDAVAGLPSAARADAGLVLVAQIAVAAVRFLQIRVPDRAACRLKAARSRRSASAVSQRPASFACCSSCAWEPPRFERLRELRFDHFQGLDVPCKRLLLVAFLSDLRLERRERNKHLPRIRHLARRQVGKQAFDAVLDASSSACNAAVPAASCVLRASSPSSFATSARHVA